MDVIKKINKSHDLSKTISELTEDELERVIKISSESYYNTSISLIMDSIFDVLIEKLKTDGIGRFGK
jgi:NAD-dependent DNA ligase